VNTFVEIFGAPPVRKENFFPRKWRMLEVGPSLLLLSFITNLPAPSFLSLLYLYSFLFLY